jgi:hypothetical protein
MDSRKEADQTTFTLTLDWLAFTVLHSSIEEVQAVIGSEWIALESGFRGYPKSWITRRALAQI